MKFSIPNWFIRCEGAVLFVVATVLFFQSGMSYWLYGAMILGPDVGMIGYVVNKKIGAFVYNLSHTYAFPVSLFGLSLVCPFFATISYIKIICILWVGHIGMDRMIGYGLKYETHFFDTHLQKV